MSSSRDSDERSATNHHQRGDSSNTGVIGTIIHYWDLYLAQLRAHPVRTKALTSAVLAAVSDISSQKLMGTPWSALNTTSTRNQMIFAFLIRGPGMNYWH
jgi:hypothetical protein